MCVVPPDRFRYLHTFVCPWAAWYARPQEGHAPPPLQLVPAVLAALSSALIGVVTAAVCVWLPATAFAAAAPSLLPLRVWSLGPAVDVRSPLHLRSGGMLFSQVFVSMRSSLERG